MARGGKRPGAGRKLGSRNKSTTEIKELAALWSEPAIMKLADLMESGETQTIQMAAANSLLDRAHGRPRPAADPKAESKSRSEFIASIEESKASVQAKMEAIIRAKNAAGL